MLPGDISGKTTTLYFENINHIYDRERKERKKRNQGGSYVTLKYDVGSAGRGRWTVRLRCTVTLLHFFMVTILYYNAPRYRTRLNMTARVNSTSQLHLLILDSERAYELYRKQFTEIRVLYSRFLFVLGKPTHPHRKHIRF